jgi:hypothetical protein
MKKIRRVIGFTSIGLGFASLVVGLSPIFPIFAEAFLVGGGFFAFGAWALAGPEIKSLYQALIQKARLSKRVEKAPITLDPLLPVRILKLAKEKSGILTVSEVAITLNIPIEQADEGLAACVRNGTALADFEVPLGYAKYRFPEFLPPEERKKILG